LLRNFVAAAAVLLAVVIDAWVVTTFI